MAITSIQVQDGDRPEVRPSVLVRVDREEEVGRLARVVREVGEVLGHNLFFFRKPRSCEILFARDERPTSNDAQHMRDILLEVCRRF